MNIEETTEPRFAIRRHAGPDFPWAKFVVVRLNCDDAVCGNEVPRAYSESRKGAERVMAEMEANEPPVKMNDWSKFTPEEKRAIFG